MIYYYDTPCTARGRKLRLRVVPVKIRQVVMLAYHVYPLEGHIDDQRTLFRTVTRFLQPMVNREVDQFIISCAHCQLVNSCSHDEQQFN